MHLRPVLALACFALGLAAGAPTHAQIVSYTGACDASAAVALDDRHFVMGNDEDNILRVYRRGRPQPLAAVSLDAYAGQAARHEEIDIEAAARIGERIYWIGSHGANRTGKSRPSRHRLITTEIRRQHPVPTVAPVGEGYGRLLDDLMAVPALDKYRLGEAAYLPPKKRDALNIEGLTATAQGTLLLGFRHPLSRDDRTLVVEITNPAALSQGARARIGRVIELDLGGGGIRAMETTPRGLVIVAGKYDHGAPYRLYRWSGNAADIPERRPLDVPADMQPEGLFTMPDGTLHLVSDDGEEDFDGRPCAAAHTEAQRFRVLRIEP